MNPRSPTLLLLLLAAPKGQVRVEGDAAEIVLAPPTGSRLAVPAGVPAGSYSVYARFGDEELFRAGQVEVPEGGNVTVRCSSSLRRCVGR